MSDSDESFDILRDIQPYSFEPLVKKFTDSVNCAELSRAAICATDNKSWIGVYLFVLVQA